MKMVFHTNKKQDSVKKEELLVNTAYKVFMAPMGVVQDLKKGKTVIALGNQQAKPTYLISEDSKIYDIAGMSHDWRFTPIGEVQELSITLLGN